MEIKSTITNRIGQVFDVVYRDANSPKALDGKEVDTVHAYCFYGDKIIIVYASKKDLWTPPGGGVEVGETIEQTVIREVREETNMRIISQKLIGYQEIFEPEKTIVQTRHLCIVEPIGPFITDPDEGEITEIKLINPADLKKYVDWGKIGDHILKRAMEMKKSMQHQ
jgi:8-oxo-dGTP diphosphatase